jgi:hypothetical protein
MVRQKEKSLARSDGEMERWKDEMVRDGKIEVKSRKRW